MASDLPQYQVGQAGVNLTSTPIHTPEGGLLKAANVEYVRVAGLGGIGTRGGLATLNTGATLGATIQALQNLPFSFPVAADLMIGLNTAETNAFDLSTDGSSFSGLTTSQLQQAMALGPLSGFSANLNPAQFSINQRIGALNNNFYYVGGNYTVQTSAPVLVVWNGTASFELFRVPTNPTSGGLVPIFISDVWVDNGLIYICVLDPGGAAPNLKGRVMSFDASAGKLSLIGNNFGNGSGENTGGFPTCLVSWLGRLFVGCNGLSGTPAGVIYSILPGIEATWTLEKQFAAGDGYPMSMTVFNGELYVGMSSDAFGQSSIRKRTATGTWSTPFSSGVTAQAYFGSLCVFNSTIFAVWYRDGTSSLIKSSSNGSSWSTDLDVGATYSLRTSGAPVVYGSNLFIPFYNPTGSAAKTGFLLKRTTGGVWSQLLNNSGLVGAAGSFQPSS